MGKLSDEVVAVRELRKELTECKKIIEDLQSLNKNLEAQLAKRPEDLRGLYVVAALKFGTMVAPMTSEMVLPLRDPKELEGYDLTVTRRVEQGDMVVRVKHRGTR